MATVVNNPPANTSGGGSGFLIGVVLLILAAIAFFYYVLPTLSTGLSGGTQVNVPEKVDVNVQQQQPQK